MQNFVKRQIFFILAVLVGGDTSLLIIILFLNSAYTRGNTNIKIKVFLNKLKY